MEEEQDNLSRNTKKVKTESGGSTQGRELGESEADNLDKRRKSPYRDAVMGINQDTYMEEGDRATDYDILEEEEEGSWFSIGMSKAENQEVRMPWRLSVIIKLVGRSNKYQFLLQRLHLLSTHPAFVHPYLFK